jgi:GcrA cell cycle regulator
VGKDSVDAFRSGSVNKEKAMNWTDERVELLRKLWTDGLSASQIAAELGGITRNAVIGKVHRLGLSGRAKSPSSAAPRQRKPRASSQMLRVSRPVVRGNTALARLPAYDLDVDQDPAPIENIIPLGQRCTLLELAENKCRWPIGDPGAADFFFCGGKTVESLPYCAYHSRIAYQPVNDRRRDRRTAR